MPVAVPVRHAAGLYYIAAGQFRARVRGRVVRIRWISSPYQSW